MHKKILTILFFVLFAAPEATWLWGPVPCIAQYADSAWARRYDGPGNSVDGAFAIAVDTSGNVYVTGDSWGFGTLDDYATIKYYPNRDTAWVRRYNGPADGDDYVNAIAVDGSGNVYVTGPSVGSGTYYDYATIKYIQYFISFAPAVNYGAGDGPYSVFCADLDEDGDLDLAVANVGSNNVSILENNGNGTFQTAVNYGTGNGSYSVFCADLDGDSDPDLAVLNGWGYNVSILKNIGNGTFQSAINYGVGQAPRGLFCGDLDGDGDLDLAVANMLSNNVSILNNNGDGTFQTKVDYGAGDYPFSIFCADLDGDLDLDIVVTNVGSNSVSVLENNGDGTFQSPVNYGVGDTPVSVFGADLDGDGDMDLAVANGYSDNISILKNNGDGTFQAKVDYAAGDYPNSVFCADLDGDGNLDLAVPNAWSDSVSILKNNGDGTFQSAINYGAGDLPSSVFCADLDGDGDFDLAVPNSDDDSVSILKNLRQVPANQPPRVFSLVSPTDGDTIFSSTTFRWQTPYDPNFGDQIRYDLYVSTGPFFDHEATIYDSLTIPRLTVGLGANTYYWKVRAYDNWGAETWSTQTWSFTVSYLIDGLTVVAFSPVDLIVTDPIGDSIGLAFNTIPGANYDTTHDISPPDGDKDDIVTIPNRLVGVYMIRVKPEPVKAGVYSLGIRVDGSAMVMLATDHPSPSPDEADTFSYNAPWFLRGDVNGDWKINITDVVYLINYLFLIPPGPAPVPQEAGEANCDGVINVTDVVYLINYLFLVPPGPPPCS